ncbi:MAG: serine protease [Desulfobacula sp.]|nr:serine protease [Desulfobacula sp.]
MKNKEMVQLLYTSILLFQFSILIAQERPNSQTNYRLDFNKYLSGVKYTQLILSERVTRYQDDDYISGFIDLPIYGIVEYIEQMGFPPSSTNIINSLCDIVYIEVDFEFVYSRDFKYFRDISYTFITCNEDKIFFKSNESIAFDNFNTKNDFYNSFLNCYKYKKPTYSIFNKLKLKRNPTKWTEYKLKDNWSKNGIGQYEGIYEESPHSNNQTRYKVGLLKITEGYCLIYLSGALYSEDWDEGEIKAILFPSATPNFFKAKWYMGNKSINNDYYISFDQGIMNFIDGESKKIYVKMYPTAKDNLKLKEASITSTGTGFAISSDGLIVTNHHLIEGKNSIKVKGVNGNFSESYFAKVLLSDKNNDLAIIKIEDFSSTTCRVPPYTIKSSTVDVGADIFLLGYPLTATMGDEIKLTNGIISSKSGYHGDITLYQMTAPIQPGNSGAPLFDKNGYLVGITNAKHIGTDNVGYAIKSGYLINLVESLSPTPKLPINNLLIGKTLTEQVKLIKEYVYIIEVN